MKNKFEIIENYEITFDPNRLSPTKRTIQLYETNEQNIIVEDLLLPGDETFCIHLKHEKLQTLLILQNVEKYLLYSFNKELNLEGIHCCNTDKKGDFRLLVQGRWLLFEKIGK